MRNDKIREFQYANCENKCPLKKKQEPVEEIEGMRVDSSEAHLHYLKKQTMLTNSEEEIKANHKKVRLRARSRKIF